MSLLDEPFRSIHERSLERKHHRLGQCDWCGRLGRERRAWVRGYIRLCRECAELHYLSWQDGLLIQKVSERP